MARPAAQRLSVADSRSALAYAFAPAALRPLLDAARALEAELSQLTRPDLDHSVAHAKLGWWQEESVRLAAGNPRHPLTRALAPFALDATACAVALQARLATAARVVAGYVAADWDDLENELAAARGLPATLMALPLGARGVDTARSLTLAIACTDVVLGVRADARRGLLYLPPPALDAAGIGPDELTSEMLPPAVTGLQRELAARARAHHAAALDGVRRGHGNRLRSLYVEAALALRELTRAERADFREGASAGRWAAADALLLAWRTARRVEADPESEPKHG